MLKAAINWTRLLSTVKKINCYRRGSRRKAGPKGISSPQYVSNFATHDDMLQLMGWKLLLGEFMCRFNICSSAVRNYGTWRGRWRRGPFSGQAGFLFLNCPAKISTTAGGESEDSFWDVYSRGSGGKSGHPWLEKSHPKGERVLADENEIDELKNGELVEKDSTDHRDNKISQLRHD